MTKCSNNAVLGVQVIPDSLFKYFRSVCSSNSGFTVQVRRNKHLLLIVGEFREDKSKYINLIDELGIAQNVKIIDNYVPDQEIENIFMSSDLVILPYISSTQSGIVQIAFGFEKPVIVTNVGGLPEVVKNGITGYVVEPKDSDAIAQATIKFFKENKAEIFSENINKESYKYSWDHMNEIINSFLL